MALRFLRYFRLLALCGLAAVLVGCTPDPVEFFGSDITGTGIGQDLSMPDTSGEVRTLDDFTGHVTVVFFGFTQCPDVCPTALAELAHTMELLGDQANDVRVVLVSVDPERDTPDVLHGYVTAFHHDFIGLTGSEQQLRATAQSFKAYYAKAPGATPEQYTMDHSASFYVFDKQGEARVLISGDAPADEIASDIQQLL